MFERFTDRARRVVVLAGDVARRHGAEVIDSAHLLTALAEEGGGIAAKALGSCGLTAAMLDQEVTDHPGSPTGKIPFSPPAKRALEHSLREALSLGHSYIGTEHVLLGLVRTSEQAEVVLARFEVSPEQVRQAVMDRLVPPKPAPPPTPRAPSAQEMRQKAMALLERSENPSNDRALRTLTAEQALAWATLAVSQESREQQPAIRRGPG
jgi:ATP-dependent Clp protease ATP-binding subunit ClpC